MKTTVFVILAFVVAAFYSLEITLTVMNRGVVPSVFVKSGIVAAAIYYAVTAIKKKKSTNTKVDADLR